MDRVNQRRGRIRKNRIWLLDPVEAVYDLLPPRLLRFLRNGLGAALRAGKDAPASEYEVVPPNAASFVDGHQFPAFELTGLKLFLVQLMATSLLLSIICRSFFSSKNTRFAQILMLRR
jgi:hypothetical protein